MRGSSGIGQLLKGIIIGIGLILAIISTMNMFEKNKSNSAKLPNSHQTDAISAKAPPEIKAPEIYLPSQTANNPPKKSHTALTESSAVSHMLESNITIKPNIKENNNAIEKPVDAIQYGILKISSINADNKENIKADYVVRDSKNIKVAESYNSSGASFRLPIGNYQITSTLVNTIDPAKRQVAPTPHTKTVTIISQNITDQVFEIEPPPTIGILQVSAINAKTKLSIKANFIIQNADGKKVASRHNVTHSLFKLKAGIYKAIVKSGGNSDFRTIVIEPGESLSEIFNLQEDFLQGKILVRVIDKKTNHPVQANIKILSSGHDTIQSLKSVSQTEIALIAGSYIVKVESSHGVSTKNISVIAGQTSHKTFQIASPSPSNTKDSVVITDSTITSSLDKKNPSEKTIKTTLKLFAKDEENQSPIKSNFYIQMPNGRNITKKIYSESAVFNLEPGNYKITVRAKDRKRIVKNIRISADEIISEIFSLQSEKAASSINKTSLPEAPIPKSTTIPNGFLNIAMLPAQKSHFIISDQKGLKIAEVSNIPFGNFKLDTGLYTVTAILNGKQHMQNIQIHKGKTTRINFDANNF